MSKIKRLFIYYSMHLPTLLRRRLPLLCCLLVTVTVAVYSFLYYKLEEDPELYREDPVRNVVCKWDNLALDLRRRMDIPPKIVLWTSPQDPMPPARLERMEKIVTTMNTKDEENVCGKMEEITDKTGGDKMEKWKACEFTMKREEIEDADVVVLPMFNFGFYLEEMPECSKRSPDQLWVLYAREPPPLSDWKDPLHSQVNWTMSYRRDSDVWTPYGKRIPIIAQVLAKPILIGNVTLTDWIAGKTKLIAGVISRCHTGSRREDFIRQMNDTGIPVDIFGGCGTPVCGRHAENCTDFWKELGAQYKFYLAFENSLCTDYITEKFWRALELGMVPVVYGGGNYEEEAPPKSYINVNDFRNAQGLMEYLRKVGEDDKKYAEYFQWRKSYRLQGNGGLSLDWCRLCKAVHKRRKLYKKKEKRSEYSFNEEEIPMKTYGDVRWWWQHQPNSEKAACRTLKKPHSHDDH